MSNITTNNLLIVPPQSKTVALYQQLAGILECNQFGSWLIQQAEGAFASRQYELVRELGITLSEIPLKDYEAIGQYYLALATNSCGKGNQDETQRLIEKVIATAPDPYKARAILLLAAVSVNRADFNSALYYFKESLEAASGSLTSIEASRGIAIIKAVEGDHLESVKDFEDMLPIVKHAPPRIYFSYMNSYAVELAEVGRLEEARNLHRHVAASVLAPAYPEWIETARDLATKTSTTRHSCVTVPSPKTEPEPEEEREIPEEEEFEMIDCVFTRNRQTRQPVRERPSLHLFPSPSQNQKTTIAPLTKSELMEMSEAQKRAFALEILHNVEIPEEAYDNFFEAVGMVSPDKDIPKELDLESASELETITRLLVNGEFGPEEIASILSALRDCDDELRRANIIDRMISFAFSETTTQHHNESEWRAHYESRLKSFSDT